MPLKPWQKMLFSKESGRDFLSFLVHRGVSPNCKGKLPNIRLRKILISSLNPQLYVRHSMRCFTCINSVFILKTPLELVFYSSLYGQVQRGDVTCQGHTASKWQSQDSDIGLSVPSALASSSIGPQTDKLCRCFKRQQASQSSSSGHSFT